jgi:hypothetical protein
MIIAHISHAPRSCRAALGKPLGRDPIRINAGAATASLLASVCRVDLPN